MPSNAEKDAAARRSRARFMIMAATIETGQQDSLVLLPPGSAGETRAVSERRRGRSRVVWASDGRAPCGLTGCRAAVCCADGVAVFTRQRAELAALFAHGTPVLPHGRVLEGPPPFTLGDAFEELGCMCGTTLMQTCAAALAHAKKPPQPGTRQKDTPASFTHFEMAQHEGFAKRSTPRRGGGGYSYCVQGQPLVLRRVAAPVLDHCGFADPGAIDAGVRSADAVARVSSWTRALRLLGGDGAPASEEQIVKRFVELLTRLRQACVKPQCLAGDWLLSGQLQTQVFAEQLQLRADALERGRAQARAAEAAGAHAARASDAQAANAAGAPHMAAAAGGDYGAAARSDGALMNFVQFLIDNPGAQETATVAVDMVDNVLAGDYQDYHVFKRALQMVHLVKHEATRLSQGGASTGDRASSAAAGAGTAPLATPGAARGLDCQASADVENMHPNVASATPQTQEKGALGKRARPFGPASAQHASNAMDVDGPC